MPGEKNRELCDKMLVREKQVKYKVPSGRLRNCGCTDSTPDWVTLVTPSAEYFQRQWVVLVGQQSCCARVTNSLLCKMNECTRNIILNQPGCILRVQLQKPMEPNIRNYSELPGRSSLNCFVDARNSGRCTDIRCGFSSYVLNSVHRALDGVC